MTLLEEWEEPELASSAKKVATVKDLVNFRKAVSYMDDKYPFSHAFGLANTRELTVTSAQQVSVERLVSSRCVPSFYANGISYIYFITFSHS